jgi:hypothetical protein
MQLAEQSLLKKGLANRLDVHTPSFTAANRNSAAMDGTFQRITQGGWANEMHKLTGNKAHFTQP